MLRHALLPTLAALLLLPAGASAATRTTTSDNWSGYAAHGSGVHFRRVAASWREPSGSCTSDEHTYSSFWVGIGGYNESSDALEQVGTELDCCSSGVRSDSAWYEMVPSASRTIAMTVKRGDRMTASVTVIGHRVTVTLADTTRHESFRRTLTVASVDTSSAEWIAEAPSECSSSSDCTVLTLSDFGTVAFSHASVTTTGGVTSAIDSSLWTTTEIVLGDSQSGAVDVSRDTTATATPSALTGSGSAFSIVYANASTGSSGSGGSGPSMGPGGGGAPGD